jgi:GTPase SAR1 family protein
MGKTCLLVRFIEGAWQQDSRATVGTNSFVVSCKTQDARPIELELMDTVGLESFRSVTKSCFGNAMFRYRDLTDGLSF